jgi:hypothetical protein
MTPHRDAEKNGDVQDSTVPVRRFTFVQHLTRIRPLPFCWLSP